ncbi:MAG TPA: flippase-like domain-containing protein [Candidatus Thermoplasmatota archaeon]|nr:flippase-like domain-containing protein [Candidatus Thermoplasmatota archaeon]
MTDEKKKWNKTKISIFVSIALSLLIIVLILYFTIDAQTIQYLSQVSLRAEFFLFFGAAVMLNVLYWFIWGARLKVLSTAIDPKVHVSLWEATKIVIANQFLAGITPSVAGGEPVRIYLLNKDGLSTGGATAAVLGERLIDAIFILVLVPFGFFVFKDRIDIKLISYGLIIGIVVFICGIILFALALKYPEKTKALLLRISYRLSRFSKKEERSKKVVNRIGHEIDNFHTSMVLFLTSGKKSFLAAGGLTILMWSTGFMIPSMILLALGLPPFFIESYAAQALLLIIVMLPTTPGSSGVTELGMAALYGVLLGASNQYLLGVFVLLFRFITYHMNMICGAIFQYRIFKSITSFSLETIEKQEG